MSPERAQTFLRWILMIIGCGLMVAYLFVLLPSSQMASIHNWLGLGEFPERPISFYLARSTSLLYGVHGTVMFIVGFRWSKYADLAPLFGWLHVVIGIAMLVIDLTSGMPWWWSAGEGVPIAATGLLIVWLAKKANA